MITVNAMGDACPIPVIKTKKALQELSGSGEIEVLVDNETAVRNVTKMAENSGASVTQEKLGEGRYRVIVRVGDGSTDPGDTPAAERTADAAAGPVCMETRLQSYLRTGWGKAMMNSDMFS